MLSSSSLILAVCLAVCISIGHGKAPSKVLMGSTTSLNKYPFQASLRIDGKHMCGAIIFDNRHFLTAASCILIEKNVYQVNIKILTGTIDQENKSSGQLHEVIKIFVHEDFDAENSFKNDIAILRVGAPIVFNLNTQRAGFFSPDLEIPVNEPVISVGWGTDVVPPFGVQRYLQELNMKIISNAECGRDYGCVIHPQQICAESPTGLSFSYGDGGGPLLKKGNRIIGIISWSAVGLPAVFTRISHYVPWIMANIAKI